MHIRDGKYNRIAAQLICAHCGCTFWKAKHRLSKDRSAYYCSKHCAQLAARNGEKVECAFCGKKVYRPRYKLDRSKHQVYFCSKTCQNRAQKIIGPEPNCYGKETNSPRILCAFHYPVVRCSHCGYDKHPALVEAHHIDSNHSNNAPENLIWLCSLCHRAVTLGLATVKKRKFKWK